MSSARRIAKVARFTDDFLTELKAAVPVIDAVKRRHKMRKAGSAEWKAVDDEFLDGEHRQEHLERLRQGRPRRRRLRVGDVLDRLHVPGGGRKARAIGGHPDAEAQRRRSWASGAGAAAG